MTGELNAVDVGDCVGVGIPGEAIRVKGSEVVNCTGGAIGSTFLCGSMYCIANLTARL